MKLPITQIVLGALVLAASGYVIWWMASGVNELLDDTVLNESGSRVANYTPDSEVLFTFSRYASWVLVAMGLITVITGPLWKRAKDKELLANIQATAGALIVVLSAVMLLWGYSFTSIVPFEGGPELTKTYAIELTVLTGLLGLAVFIIGLTLRGRYLRKDNT